MTQHKPRQLTQAEQDAYWRDQFIRTVASMAVRVVKAQDAAKRDASESENPDKIAS
jgi:hypothetical protein